MTITAQGIENSLRGAKDGITYFGCKKRGGKAGIRVRKGEIVNDIVIKTKDKEIAQRHRGRHFQIQYSLATNNYLIKDLGVGFGAYIRIDNPLILKDNHLLSMGESFFIINLISNANGEKPSESKDDNSRLRIKIFAGPANGEIL